MMCSSWCDVGAFPYCFALPKYPDASAPNMRMGQAPGTHWYHAHKHGSTAIDVSNGMAGAFIIEGDAYDGKLNAFYNQYRTDKSTDWTRQQPTLMVNQIGTTPSLVRGDGRGAGPPSFSVNGEQEPSLTMYPGQVQLWRIVNLSPISGFYISGLPEGFKWRQTAQDGVQFDDQNYQKRAQRPVFVAPGNRIDLLVNAPEKPANKIFPVTAVQGVSVSQAQTSTSSVVLFTVVLSGSGPAMPLMPHAPPRPGFLRDIKPGEVVGKRTLTFETTNAASGHSQHTIDGVKFEEGKPLEIKPLNTVEEWTVENKTVVTLIDHPFHIHVNPFQVTEVFDPNAPLLDDQGFPVRKDGKVVNLYVVSTTKPLLQPGQCWLNPNDQSTWKPCNTSLRAAYPPR
jgi:FtsP/CotA-like multicopper oxidase with cupredoxin domain